MSATDKAILGKDTYGIKMNGSRHSGIAGKGRIGYDFGENWSLNFTEIFLWVRICRREEMSGD